MIVYDGIIALMIVLILLHYLATRNSLLLVACGLIAVAWVQMRGRQWF